MLSIQKHKSGLLYSAILGMALLLASPAQALIEADHASAVIFVYQRVGEDSQPSSSISVDTFKSHIKELKTGGYNVLPLSKIIEVLKEGETLPLKTVGITFEGGYLSTLNNAVPVLEEAELPYAVFFASDMADGSNPSHMTWSQLKSLRKKKGVTLGILPSAYAHLAGLPAEQSSSLINKAVTRYKENFGDDPEYFAYPYGEFSTALKKQVASYNFKASFGQHSGVVYAKSDFMALPRFTMTDAFGDLERFQLTARALPLPVTDITPEDTLIKDNPPMIGFTVTPEITSLGKLSCFLSGSGKAETARPGGGRVEIRLKEPPDVRRTRVNCTLPDDTIIPGEPQSWRWLGMLLVAPDLDEDAPPPVVPDEEDDTRDE